MSNIKTNEMYIWENPAIVSVNKEPGHSLELPYPDKNSAITGDPNPYRLSLNGVWDFYWQIGCKALPGGYENVDFDSRSWDKITVPCVWQFQGYGQPLYYAMSFPQAIGTDQKKIPEISHGLQEVGIYRKSFTVPRNFAEREIFLHFGALKSAAEISVNGHYVGYTLGSMTPHEFNVTKYLVEGENIVVATVYRYSVGTYFEDQDMWFLSGIYRDVFLYAESPLAVRDIFACADLDQAYENGSLTVTLKLNNFRGISNASISVFLFETQQNIGERTLSGDEDEVVFSAEIPTPAKWSPEFPSLYTVVIALTIDGVTEYKSVKVGFKKIEIHGNVLRLNGKRLLLRGVNRHDYHPETGWAVPYETYLQDLTFMKQWNINAIRTSHYPNDPRLYELCDKMGILVMDECDMETHGVRTKNIPGNDPRWTPHVLDRMSRMILRDRNHPCIFMWSLGNEAGSGSNFFKMKTLANTLDPTRPVHYEGYIHQDTTDVISRMYPKKDNIEAMAEKRIPYNGISAMMNKLITNSAEFPLELYETMPVIFCEYAHAMENSLGNFKEHMDIMEAHDHMAGAFIWDFVDQAILRKTKDGSEWLYGDDFAEIYNKENGLKSKSGVGSNSYFCANGIIGADRIPHPAAAEVKKVYQTIKVREKNLSEGQFVLRNLQIFTNMAPYLLNWRIERKGVMLQSGTMDGSELNIEPLSEKEIVLPFALADLPKDDLICTLEFAQKEDTFWAAAGYVQAFEQFRISSYVPPVTEFISKSITTEQKGASITVSGENFRYQFENGACTNIVIKDEERLVSPLLPNYFRAVTDNDVGAFNFKTEYAYLCESYRWLRAQKAQTPSSVELKTEKNAATVIVTWKMSGFKNVVTTYIVRGDGSMEVIHCATPQKKTAIRIGMTLGISSKYNTVDWIGRGPTENYCDRKSGSPIGHYRLGIQDFEHRYMRPQENGHRCEVTNLTVSDGFKPIVFTAMEASGFECNVFPYAQEDVEKAKHLHQLAYGDTYIYIDAAMRGVGGDFPGMLALREEYTLKKDFPYTCHYKMTF